MAKRESTFINMVVTLFAVTFIASATLGGIYELTKEPIAKAKLEKKLKAIQLVVPEFDNDPNSEMYTIKTENDDMPLEVYPAKKGDKLVGVAVKSYTMKGYSGLIQLMVGFKPDGTINKISVLQHAETPGLGTKMTDASFKDQFYGKNPADFNLEVKKDGGDVDAITAATISSRAFCDAVKRAYDQYMKGGKK
ncbi:MAG TPA: RnfABCDGE type electron transport complex subunit G [Salinivirga sp.]|uniref:RnfABCDGE type electron transport complex subunit G n=1 Tax=Salinivirga sp. TaxID=1970192 RepID=UPI002B45DB8B|nr:RnfABCDGE type electron transport complex subunit G [Salinivirga sp.]HKK59462.1 RnfABCDGE type electron transport complex subunit G [Salinivirga sp.]